MQNRRLQDNPGNQNEEYYTLIPVRDDLSGWNTVCDFYINSTSYKPDITTFSTKKSSWKRQIGVIIIDDGCREVFESLCMKDYILRNISTYTINKCNIHQAFNEQHRQS